MRTFYNHSIYNRISFYRGSLFVFYILLLIFFISPTAQAENIQQLQHNASTAYEQMMRAKLSAERSAKDASFAERKVASMKQKLSVAEKEAENARNKSEQARISFEQATNRWKQASDTLAEEWKKTDRK